MVLPFVTILAKLYFCSLADRHRAHRSFFVLFLATALLGYGSFGILPFFIKPQPKELGLNIVTWVLVCIMTSIATISMGVISCLSDAFAMNSSKKKNTSYGLIRVWGTLGWGASSLALAFINQTDKLPLLVPGLFMTIVLLTTDVVVASCWPNHRDYELDKASSSAEFEDFIANRLQPIETYGSTTNSSQNASRNNNQVAIALEGQADDQQDCGKVKAQANISQMSSVKLQWLLFLEVAKRRKSIFRYMTIFTISGILISLQWSYFFLYLNNIYSADFSFISGLSMVGQSMMGELPFFIVSKYVVQYLGRSHTLSLSIISIGVRYLLYQYLLPNHSMYFVLLTEALQGPSFGLFYVVMTEVGLDYSDCEAAILVILDKGLIEDNPKEIQRLRLALCATMQSLMSACYEGLGIGIGSILGGLVIDNFGFPQLWLYSSLIAIGLGSLNILIEFMSFSVFKDEKLRVT